MNQKKKVVNLLVSTAILSAGGSLISPISASAQINNHATEMLVQSRNSVTVLEFISKYNLGDENIAVLENLKSEFVAQHERGALGSVNDAIKLIIKYVNFLPNSSFKTQLLRILEPLRNLLNTGQVITISVLQITLKAWGCADWFIEMVIDLVHFFIF